MTLSKALCASSAAVAESSVVADETPITLRPVGTRDRAGMAAVRDAGRAEVAELATEVADAFQRMGIGTALTSLTIHHAHANGWTFLTATTLWENRAARGLLRNHGFRARRSRGGEIEHELKLEESSPREAVRVPDNPRVVARAASVPSPSSTEGTTNSRLTASDSPTANASPHHINRKELPMSHRRLTRERLARLRQHAAAPLSLTYGAHRVSLLARNPVPAVRPHYAR